MKSTATALRLTYNEQSQPELTLTLSATKSAIMAEVQELKAILANGKALTVEIRQFRAKRSLDANSYAWLIISKIAEAMSQDKGHIYTKDEIYIEMLKRYGQREPKLLSVVSDAVDMVYRATQNHCCEVGESELNGKLFKHLAILIGSSQYDSVRMAMFINGVVEEAKGLGIETLTPQEISLLKIERL